MFGLPAMNLVKVEKNEPLLERGLSAAKTAAPRLQAAWKETSGCSTKVP